MRALTLAPVIATLALVACGVDAEPLDLSEAHEGPVLADQARLVVLTLTLDNIATPGGVASYTATGANANETVHFVRAFGTGTGPCPAALGGGCLDLDANSTTLLGSTVADGDGEATWDIPIPATAPVGATLVVQAVAVRGVGGVDSVKSPAVDTQLVSSQDIDGDGYDTTVDCDDDDATIHPGAIEVCDGVDNDCDPGTTEDGLVSASGVSYASIGDATNFTPPGGVISICPGTYTETFTVDRDVQLIGVGGAAATIIDGGGATVPVIEVAGGLVVFQGLTITGGADSGVRMTQDSDLEIIDTVITGNSSLSDGGGIDIAAAGAYLWASGVEISANTASSEGGGLYMYDGSLTLLDATFLDNVGDSGGGAIYLDGRTDSVTITDSVFHRNEAGGTGLDGGGALLIDESAADVVVTNSDFGVGPTENYPNDVFMYDSWSGDLEITYYQAGETFTCDTGTNTCQ